LLRVEETPFKESDAAPRQCYGLEAEAAKFFARANSDRAESRGFRTASLRSLERDEQGGVMGITDGDIGADVPRA